MTVHALVPKCALSVLSYSECEIVKKFQLTPQLHNGFPPRYASQKTGTPKKLLDTALDMEQDGHLSVICLTCSIFS